MIGVLNTPMTEISFLQQSKKSASRLDLLMEKFSIFALHLSKVNTNLKITDHG